MVIDTSDIKALIQVDMDTVVTSCYACPTIFDFKDIHGRPYYFRLRHGGWRLSYDDTEQTIVSGASREADGYCSWDEAVEMVLAEGVVLIPAVGKEL